MSTQINWPASRAKSFLKHLNEHGYTLAQPSTYENDMSALAHIISVSPSIMLSMNPINYGKRAFNPLPAEAALKRLLGHDMYYRMTESHKREQVYLHNLIAKYTTPSTEPVTVTKEEQMIAGIMFILVE